LEKFGRALILRWLWHSWDHRDRPWKHLLKIYDPVDMQLFFCSTIITGGDGRNTPFWEARWLNGAAPKELASNLFIVSRYKRRNVNVELRNNNWIRNLRNINSADLSEEFTLLFLAISVVELSDKKDAIYWKWASNGQYSVKSAYEAQFKGGITHFPAPHMWQARTEPKCRVFAWLTMHDRVLTTHNMIKKLALQSHLQPLLLHA
jgi:hypothetical protein